ncbi:MAG: Eco57I restriction-modification methylase domain-containing protein [Brevefilum sp.]|nr:Eco57I restriction-modification methylase domain-containing protein [Brevefilum sp.]
MIKPTNIHTSGGVFTHHFIESILQDRVGHPALKAETFTLPNYDRLTEKAREAGIAETWEDLVGRWDAVEREFGALDISALRRRWLLPLFKALGFNLEFNKGDLVLEEDYRFPISHLGWAGTSNVTVPIHTLLYTGEKTLETKAMPGRGIKAMAPHDMLQRYLNLSGEHRWGLLTDGVALRLERDYYHTYTRGYTQFDLQGIFSTRDYASFRALFRLLHASRFIVPEGQDQAPIDDLYEDALAMGVAVGKDLRENVQKAIESLGNGFLRSTPGLLEQLRSQDDGAQDLYHEILVTIYRVLFLLFAEQRGMTPGRGSLYMEEFSLTALRTLAERPRGDDPNADLWEKLKTTFAMLEHGVDELGIFPYNGALFSLRRTPLLTPADDQGSPRCRNDALLTTIRHLTTVEKERVLQRISYADLSVEEIGSIYESLLEITPRITMDALTVDDRQVPSNTFFLDLRGLGRKTSGSYYTPPSLVNELIKSALEPVMADRLGTAVPGYELEMVEVLNEAERQLAEAALLGIKVVDPAAGSGAFLIAADNRLGLELARVRSGSLFPPEDVIRHARRDVLENSIHGVDLNPMAVELCKVGLWINAAVEDAPLNFLDHHIQCGNSLVGATPELVKGGVPNEAYNPVTGDDKALASALKRQNRQERDGQASLGFTVTLIRDEQALKDWLRARDLAGSQPSAAEKAFTKFQTSREYWEKRLPYDLWTAAFFAPIQKGEPIPTTHHVRQALDDPGAVPDELRALARGLAGKHRFFHWHLAFPEVFDRDGAGGFDVVLGNPPWERVKLQEKEFYAGKDEAIADAPNAAARKRLIRQLAQTNTALWQAYQFALHQAEAGSNFYHNSEVYPLAGRGDINLYQVFAELGRQLIADNGRAGMIVPTGVATDDTCKYFFADLVEQDQIASLYDFENRKKLFPDVDSRMKFCLLTLRGMDENDDQPGDYAFFLFTPDDLQDGEKTFTLSAADFKLLNPNTRTCPIFRSRADAELTRKLYQQAPVLINEETGENPWGVSFSTMFHMSNDSHLFRTKEQMEAMGFVLQGNVFVRGDEVYLPLYEAKMFWHYDHRHGTYEGVTSRSDTHLNPIPSRDPNCLALPWYWVSFDDWKIKGGEKFYLVFRNITNITNERSAIATIIPPAAIGHSAPIINSTQTKGVSFLIANLSSFVFDYIVRQKVGGTNFTYHYFKQLPTISLEKLNENLLDKVKKYVLQLVYTSYDLFPYAELQYKGTKSDNNHSSLKIKTKLSLQNSFPEYIELLQRLFDDELSGNLIPPYEFDATLRYQIISELDAVFGHLYNLTREEFAYILDTFPIVRRKDEAEYGEYRTKRVILEKFDALADDPILEGACIPLDERVSVLKKPAKTQAKKPLLTPPPAPKSETKPQAAASEPGGAETLQPDLPEEPAVKEPQPALISDYTLYYCPKCEKRVLGFDLGNHTWEVHQGVDPGYEEMK